MPLSCYTTAEHSLCRLVKGTSLYKALAGPYAAFGFQQRKACVESSCKAASGTGRRMTFYAIQANVADYRFWLIDFGFAQELGSAGEISV